MRNWLIVLVLCVACGVWGLAGCGNFPLLDGILETSDFLGLPISSFSGTEALDADSSAVTSKTAEASFPDDLLQDVPDGAVMVLSVPDLAVTVDNEPTGSSTPGVLHATVTFRLAPRGSDACASENIIGPFDITIEDGEVNLVQESLPLDKATQSAVRSGRVEICAETSADFDGTMSIGKVVIEFGTLNSNEKKVELCHVPPDDPGNQHTINVGSSAVDAHLAHGDYLGACEPNTDADGDNVVDTSDLCPDTPTGEEVDTAGCSCSQSDSDSDGVNDCDDLCSNTPADEESDSTGCSCSQLDSDSDGLSDCDDLCPSTPANAAIDGFGCQIIVADAGADITLSEIGLVTLQGSASGGASPYTYSWSATGWAGSTEQNPTAMPSDTTIYTLTVTDWSFPPKTATDTVTITIDPHDGLQYTIVDIGSLSSKSSYPAGINEAGDVVGYYYNDSWKKRAFLYQNGSMTDIGDVGGGEAYAHDINNNGQVVGEAKTSGGSWHAFLWDNTNGMQDLGTLGGSTSIAYAINDAGEIVGYSATASGSFHAFVYRNGAIDNTGTLSYAQSGAFDINDSSEIVGILLPAQGNATAFVYSGGTLTDLGSPMLSGSQAWVINDAGLIVGYSWGTAGYRSWLYNAGTVIDLGVLEGFPETYVWGMSETGQVVGHISDGGSVSHAFVYTGGSLQDLNGLLATGHGWEYLTAAYAANSNGQIVGYGRIDGQYSGFILTPVP